MNCRGHKTLFLSLLLASLIPISHAQERELANSTKDAQKPYSASMWYFYPPSPRKKGVAFFTMGYNYYYQNFDLKATLLQLGLGSAYYADTNIMALFSGRVGVGVGYRFRYPFNVKKYKLMEHIGRFTLGWYPSNMFVSNTSRIGLMNLYAQDTQALLSMRVYRNTMSIGSMLVNLPDIVRLDTQARFVYDYAIDYDEHLYEVYFNASLVQDHGFGELALKPFVSYTNSIGDVKAIKAQKSLLQHMTFSIFGPVPFYNFAGGALFEYRFFFLSFLNSYQWYEDFYISASYNVAYIDDEARDVGEVKMYYGGAIGFNLFGSVPFSFQFLIDEDANMVFSIMSAIIPPY